MVGLQLLYMLDGKEKERSPVCLMDCVSMFLSIYYYGNIIQTRHACASFSPSKFLSSTLINWYLSTKKKTLINWYIFYLFF